MPDLDEVPDLWANVSQSQFFMLAADFPQDAVVIPVAKCFQAESELRAPASQALSA